MLEFSLDGGHATAVAIGGTEHYGLPRIAPQLTDVNVGLGWFQPGGERSVQEFTRLSSDLAPAALAHARSAVG